MSILNFNSKVPDIGSKLHISEPKRIAAFHTNKKP